jgi:hypothetical protein
MECARVKMGAVELCCPANVTLAGGLTLLTSSCGLYGQKVP